MTRILLLVIFLLWMIAAPEPSPPHGLGTGMAMSLFFGVYVLLIAIMGLWSRYLAARLTDTDLHTAVYRYSRIMGMARAFVPAWFAFGLFGLGWTMYVQELLQPLHDWPVQLPGLLLGSLPALLAWMGLWWSQFPADRALREQSLLIQLNESLPVHAPPSFWSYFSVNLRLQMLFTIVPVLMIVLLRDLTAITMVQFGFSRGFSPTVDGIVTVSTAAVVFFFAPEILRRVLHTQPLPNSPLRRRLESLARQMGLRYRDILLWRTDHNLGNAAVMGMIPQLRYILLSDLILETMTDQQIEAVFAHEVGHVVHRHLSWYGVFVVMFILLMMGPGQIIDAQLSRVQFGVAQDVLVAFVTGGGFFLAFGLLSRRFERQADVFAARTLERARGSGLVIHVTAAEADAIHAKPELASQRDVWHVGPYGASAFGSALHRVAVINNIPVGARNFTHGSIANRMDYLQQISIDPTLTTRFDRTMSWLYVGMIVLACILGVWAGAAVLTAK